MKIVAKRKWRYPEALERSYAKVIVAYVKDMMRMLQVHIPDIVAVIEQYKVRIDDDDNTRVNASVDVVLDQIRQAITSPETIRHLIIRQFHLVNSYNHREFEAICKSALGTTLQNIPMRQDAAADDYDKMRDIWVQNNIDLIKSIDDETMVRIRRYIADAIVNNVDTASLTKNLTEELQRITGIDINRATLIAVDQVGKLNGRATQYRQQHAGLTEYKWHTAMDIRVRDTHAEREGRIYSWNKPPGDGHPGHPIRCRCVALPVFDLEKLGIKPRPGKTVSAEPKSAIIKEKEPIINNPDIQRVVNTLKNLNVEYREPVAAIRPVSESRAIDALAGSDRTSGSCVSLGLAYIGRMNGWEVLDFRGGYSQSVFSAASNLKKIVKASGVHVIKETARSQLTAGNRLLKRAEPKKRYYFVAGSHAAIVRKTEGGKFQYLELQSTKFRGWTDFNGNLKYTLHTRFGCRDGRGLDEEAFMFDIDNLKGSDELKTLLGYINTEGNKQLKGAGGSVK